MKNENKTKIAFLAGAGIIIVLMCVFIFFGKVRKAGNKDVTIVCSFYPVYVLAENIFEGTGVNVVNMTENLTGCIHDYQMTTKDMKALEGARLLMVNGGGMESFLENVKKNYPDLPIIEVSECHPEEDNPHIWMNTDYEMDCIDHLCTVLCEEFPDMKDVITKNAEKYADKIFKEPYNLRLEILDKLELEERNIRVICFNEAFEVFSESLVMNNIAVFSLDENETPSAGEIAEAIEKAKRCKEVIVLIEEELAFNADKIVAETGAKVICIDPLTSGNNKDSYIDGMMKNLKAIDEYLDQNEEK